MDCRLRALSMSGDRRGGECVSERAFTGGAGLGLGYGAFGGPTEPQPLSRAIGQVGDRVGQFDEGPHCT